MPEPLVSVVIVNWRTPDLLSGCLDSLLADGKADRFEILVVDNASADRSCSMLSECYPQVRVIANAENVGFARACNQAIVETSGKYVLLLNPDTVVGADAVSRLAEFLESNPEAGAVGPRILNADGSLQLACRRSFPDPLSAAFRVTYLSFLFPKHRRLSHYNLSWVSPDERIEVDALSGACMMVRRKAIDVVGLLDDDIFMFGEDIDWCWRIKEAGFAVFYLPDASVHHYHGAASRLRPVRATVNLHRGMQVFYRKHLAPRHPALLNLLVYSAIWARAGLFVALLLMRQLFSGRYRVPERVLDAPKGSNL